MSAHNNPFNPTERVLRQFGWLWIGFFGGMAAWQWVGKDRPTLGLVLAVLAVTIGPLGVAWPRAIRPVFVGWMTLAYPIGWVVSRVVLGFIFYFVFTPMAWLFRLIGRDVLELKSRPTASSYWHAKPKVTDQSAYLRPF